MGKLLRVLVVFYFVLAGGALFLGIHLFGKRELLKGRTQKLEKAVYALGQLTESGPAVLERKPEYPAKDVSPCQEEILETPELSPFWDTYQAQLEEQGQAYLDLTRQRKELMTYYFLDPVTLKKTYDELGRPITEGPGTMQEVLNALIDKTREQLKRLNDTRAELKKLREEYVLTVQELNERKKFLRERLVEIVNLKRKIAELEEKIRQLEAKVAQLENEIRALNEQIAELKRQLTEKEEQIATLQAEVTRLSNEVIRLKPKTSDTIPEGGYQTQLKSGEKGTVAGISGDAEWNYVVVELNDDCMQELLGPDLTRPLPLTDVWVKRPREGASDLVVARLRLRDIKRETRLAVGDVLPPFRQGLLQKGDVVFIP